MNEPTTDWTKREESTAKTPEAEEEDSDSILIMLQDREASGGSCLFSCEESLERNNCQVFLTFYRNSCFDKNRLRKQISKHVKK